MKVSDPLQWLACRGVCESGLGGALWALLMLFVRVLSEERRLLTCEIGLGLTPTVCCCCELTNCF